VFVHRDYHSRNLMVASADAGNGRNPGILDFQDAVRGPITYDLVSLLKDAYIEWEEEQVLEWAIRYWKAAGTAGLPVDQDFGAFYRDFEWMGLQRHLKVLGIFARLYHRDGKDQYLAYLPLVMRHTRKTCERYIAFTPLLRLFDAIEKLERPGGYTF
jgi:aminoglycoside/choline kinase family phosphotransferase